MSPLNNSVIPPPAPAAPAAEAAAPAPAPAPIPVAKDLTPDTLVSVQVNGETRQEPWAKVMADYGKIGTLESRLVAANQAEQQFQSYQRTHGQDIQTMQQLRAMIATNPEAAVETFKAMASQAAGRPVAAGADTPADGTPVSHDPRVSALASELNAMKAKLGHMEDRAVTAEAQARIDKAMAPYTLFKNEPALAEFARYSLAGAAVAAPNVPLEEIASRLHTKLQEGLSRQETTVRDQRAAVAQELRGVAAGAGAGTPEMGTDQPALTVKDLKGGDKSEFNRRLASAWQKFQGRG